MKNSQIKFSRPVVFVLASLAALCTGYFVFTMEARSHLPGQPKETAQPVRVSVITVSPAPYPVRLTAHGQALPDRVVTVRSAVSGPLIWVSDSLKKGLRVKKGQVLARVDPLPYQASLARARQAVALARLDLLKEEEEASQARSNWRRSGFSGLPSSSLVFRKPQLAAAREALASAKAQADAARNECSRCEVRSPVDGLVTERFISQGEWIDQTGKVVRIFDTARLVVEVTLSADQYGALETPLANNRVEFADTQTASRWPARLVRDGGRMLPESRLRPVFCELEAPMTQDPPLLPGTFLSVEITGRVREGLLKLPESCLTPQGRLWYTRPGGDRLDCIQTKPVFYRNGSVYIPAPPEADFPIQVARFPNQAFKKGMPVTPVLTENRKEDHASDI